MAKERPSYRCTQSELYSIIEMAWENYKKYQARFSAYKGKYSASTRTDALAALTVAKAMPDDDARSSVSMLARVDVVKAGNLCLDNFQYLLGYIDEVWRDKAARDAQYLAAGQRKYAAAANEDWEQLDAMNMDAKAFIAGNTAVLLGVAPNLNMPVGFPVSFNVAVSDFVTKYRVFKSVLDTGVATGAKVKANNDLYDVMMAMFGDAQRVFMHEPDIAVLFQFSHLLGMISQTVAGMRGTVKETGSNKPIAGAQISAQKEGDVAVVFVTDVDGKFSRVLSGGKYVVTVMAVGYVSQTITVDVVDTMRGVDFLM